MANPRILIMDDDPNLRKTLADIRLAQRREPFMGKDPCKTTIQ